MPDELTGRDWPEVARGAQAVAWSESRVISGATREGLSELLERCWLLAEKGAP